MARRGQRALDVGALAASYRPKLASPRLRGASEEHVGYQEADINQLSSFQETFTARSLFFIIIFISPSLTSFRLLRAIVSK